MKRKNAALIMGLLMSITMSFVLSLIGNLSSERFTLKGFLISFLVSLLIGLVIGRFIPMKQISDSLIGRYQLKIGSVKARLLEAAVSALSFSPLMTFLMVSMAYRQAVSHGAVIPFGPMLLKAEILSTLCAFVLSFILTPVYVRLLSGDRMNHSSSDHIKE